MHKTKTMRGSNEDTAWKSSMESMERLRLWEVSAAKAGERKGGNNYNKLGRDARVVKTVKINYE